jgi:hypothetical protein
MQRRILTCLTFTALGFACGYAQTREQVTGGTPTEISALQRQRIELLQARASRVEALVTADIVDREALIRACIDVINARLDYARSNDEKRQLLTDLMGEYDKLILIAEVASRVPESPATPGQRNVSTRLGAVSDVLFLKSERIRVQISRDILDP